MINKWNDDDVDCQYEFKATGLELQRDQESLNRQLQESLGWIYFHLKREFGRVAVSQMDLKDIEKTLVSLMFETLKVAASASLDASLNASREGTKMMLTALAAGTKIGARDGESAVAAHKIVAQLGGCDVSFLDDKKVDQ